MRIALAVVAIAGCGRAPAPPSRAPGPVVAIAEAPPEPTVTLALVATGARTHFDRWSDFTTGVAPMTFAATAPRGTQLVVWIARYHHHELDPAFCPHRVYRFERSGTVPLTLDFDWNPKPGNVFHYYAIELGGATSAATLVKPDQSATVTDAGDGADPAAIDTDYLLFYVMGGRDQATGFGPIADGIAINDGGIVIRARFVAPSERPVGFDVTRCEPLPGPR